jgi:hypothetical protein
VAAMSGERPLPVKRPIGFWIAWIIAIGVIVHLDWHLGRPHHIPLSLAFPHHWIVGLIIGFVLAANATRSNPTHAIGLFALVGGLGLFAGQVLEPIGEVLYYDGVTLANVYPYVRWRLFGQFAIAFVVGGASVLIGHYRRAQAEQLATSMRSGHV